MPNQYEDKELRTAVREFGKRGVEFPGVSGTVKVVPTTEEVDAIMQLITQKQKQSFDEGYTSGRSSVRPINRGNKSYGAGA